MTSYKITTLFLLSIVVVTMIHESHALGAYNAFAPSLLRARQRQQRNKLSMGWFDFKPVHGSGSAGQQELDEQWEAQQAILRARRGEMTKDHLHQKYKSGSTSFNVKARDLAVKEAQHRAFQEHTYVANTEPEPHIQVARQKESPKATKTDAHKKQTFKFPWQ